MRCFGSQCPTKILLYCFFFCFQFDFVHLPDLICWPMSIVLFTIIYTNKILKLVFRGFSFSLRLHNRFDGVHRTRLLLNVWNFTENWNFPRILLCQWPETSKNWERQFLKPHLWVSKFQYSEGLRERNLYWSLQQCVTEYDSWIHSKELTFLKQGKKTIQYHDILRDYSKKPKTWWFASEFISFKLRTLCSKMN